MDESTSEECRLVATGDRLVQFDQRRRIGACRSHAHAAAHHRINHPEIEIETHVGPKSFKNRPVASSSTRRMETLWAKYGCQR